MTIPSLEYIKTNYLDRLKIYYFSYNFIVASH